MKFCDSEEIENNAVAARLLILFETRSCEVLPQLQNHLHCPRCLRWSGLFFLKLSYAFNFFGAVNLGGSLMLLKLHHDVCYELIQLHRVRYVRIADRLCL